jgi:predicted O-methyltransferase YrrM
LIYFHKMSNSNSHSFLPDGFRGEPYRLTNNWFDFIPLSSHQERPIRYLEIGTFLGGNILSALQTYGLHPQSILYGIDPYEEYAEYEEYKEKMEGIYETYRHNLLLLSELDQRKIMNFRGYSYERIPKFEDEYFDMIYIDGNHLAHYVLEDAVLSFRKLKVGGYMIFDDYGWKGDEYTKRGVDAFLHGFQGRVEILGARETQVFVRKVS